MSGRRRARACLFAISVGVLVLLAAGVGPRAAGRATLIDAAGLSAELEAREGRVVLVNFWATWCRPCLDEIPDLQDLEARLGERGFDLMPVSLDDPESMEAIVEPFIDKWFPTFSTYLSGERDMDTMVSVVDPAWNEVLPTSYVLGRDGKVVARFQGGSAPANFEAAILPLLEVLPQSSPASER